jgi:hypothetical protein
MKTRSVLDILAGATRRLQQASGSRGASAMKRRLKGLLKPPFQSPLPKPPARRMHGASHRSQVCCIAARWAHSAIVSTCEQGPDRHLRDTFLEASGKAEAWEVRRAGSRAHAVLGTSTTVNSWRRGADEASFTLRRR